MTPSNKLNFAAQCGKCSRRRSFSFQLSSKAQFGDKRFMECLHCGNTLHTLHPSKTLPIKKREIGPAIRQ